MPMWFISDAALAVLHATAGPRTSGPVPLIIIPLLTVAAFGLAVGSGGGSNPEGKGRGSPA